LKRFIPLITLFFLLLFLFIVSSCRAQTIEIGYGPYSNRGIGDLPKTSNINVSLLYKVVKTRWFRYVPGIRYVHLNSKDGNVQDRTGTKVVGQFNLFFLVPASFNFPFSKKMAALARFGYGFSAKHFPNKNGFARNFLLEAGVKYAVTSFLSFSLRYSHISNGDFGDINPGVDNIEVAAGINF
jgi:hypothetical protein